MLKTNSDFENKGIERILELSADAHIRRRGTIVGSPEFHNLTGAIAAYGRTLTLLTGLQQWKDSVGMTGQRDARTSIANTARPVCSCGLRFRVSPDPGFAAST